MVHVVQHLLLILEASLIWEILQVVVEKGSEMVPSPGFPWPFLLPLPLPSKETRKGCVTVDSLLHLDEPPFPQLKTGGGESTPLLRTVETIYETAT